MISFTALIAMSIVSLSYQAFLLPFPAGYQKTQRYPTAIQGNDQNLDRSGASPILYQPASNYQSSVVSQSQKLGIRGQGTSYSIGTLPSVPMYTSLLNDFDRIAQVVKQYLIAALSGSTSVAPASPLLQYIMLLHAYDELVEAVNRNIPYSIIYVPTVNRAIIKTIGNPTAVATSVWQRLDKTTKKIARLRDIVAKKQMNCDDPNSFDCNVLIETSISTSNDPILKQEAKFLSALGEVMKLFKHDYGLEFEKVARTIRAESYLIHGFNRLQAIISAAADARRLGMSIPDDITSVPGFPRGWEQSPVGITNQSSGLAQSSLLGVRRSNPSSVVASSDLSSGVRESLEQSSPPSVDLASSDPSSDQSSPPSLDLANSLAVTESSD